MPKKKSKPTPKLRSRLTKRVKKAAKPAKAKAPSKYAQVAVKRFKLDELEDAPYNPRTVTAKALSGLTRSLDEFGLIALPVVNLAGGKKRLVGGHQRVKVLKERGDKHVQAIVVDFDLDQEKRANLLLNSEAIQGQFVPELTKAVLDAIKTALPANNDLFDGLNFTSLVQRINRRIEMPETKPGRATKHKTKAAAFPDEDEVPNLPSKTKADSRKGVFYALGNHVVHCGPPTLQGTLEGFPVTRATVGLMEVTGDMPTEGFLNDHLGRLLKDTDGAVYVVTTTDRLAQVHRAFHALGGHWSSTVLWLHPNTPPDALQPYTNALIPVVYGWREGAKHAFYGSQGIGNVFTLKRNPATAHMPVEIATKALLLSSDEQGWVFDPAAGHGATLIAAEKTGRRLLGYVRTPRECDRLRKRWAEFANGKDANWTALTPAQS